MARNIDCDGGLSESWVMAVNAALVSPSCSTQAPFSVQDQENVGRTFSRRSSTSLSASRQDGPASRSFSAPERDIVAARRAYEVSFASNRDSRVRHCLCNESYVAIDEREEVYDYLIFSTTTARQHGYAHCVSTPDSMESSYSIPLEAISEVFSMNTYKPKPLSVHSTPLHS